VQGQEVILIGKKTDDVNVNESIRAKSVRLIAADGSQLGIMSVREALDVAKVDGLDVVEVAPNADPPVCRVMDYGKFKYQASKKAQESKKKSKTIQLKEIRLRPNTEEHDLETKLNNVKKFLEKRDRVKISVLFRGREMSHLDVCFTLLKKMAEKVAEVGTVEQPPTKEGWRLTMVLVPK
jgi:translation initiation factor IF-3